MTDEEAVELLDILRVNRLMIRQLEEDNKGIQKALLERYDGDVTYEAEGSRYIARLVTTNTDTVNLEKLASVRPDLLEAITERRLKKALLDETIDKGLWTEELYASVVHTEARQHFRIEPIADEETDEESEG